MSATSSLANAYTATVATIGTIYTGVVRAQMMEKAYAHADTMAQKERDDKIGQLGVQHTLTENLEKIHAKTVKAEKELKDAEGRQKIAEAVLTEAKKNDAARNIDVTPLEALFDPRSKRSYGNPLSA